MKELPMAGFTILPNEIASDENIKAYPKLALLVIACHASQKPWRMSQAQIAKEMPASLTAAKEAIKWLRENKFIIVKGGVGNGGQGTSFYSLNFNPQYYSGVVKDTPDAEEAVVATGLGGSETAPDVGQIDESHQSPDDYPQSPDDSLLVATRLATSRHTATIQDSIQDSINTPVGDSCENLPPYENPNQIFAADGTKGTLTQSSAAYENLDAEMLAEFGAEELRSLQTTPPDWEDGPLPDFATEKPATPQHHVVDSSRDGAEVRPDPTLADGVVLRNSNNRWKPTDAAMATARDVVHITDIPLHLARYVVTKAEKRQTPTSAEWLRWIFEDEKRAKAEQVKEMREVRTNRRWDAVAE